MSRGQASAGAPVRSVPRAASRTADPSASPAPVFICGITRSGTTLLLRLLDSHPLLAVLPSETQVFRLIADRFVGRTLLRIANALDWHALPGLIGVRPFTPGAARGRHALAAGLHRWLQQFPNLDADAGHLIDDVVARARRPDRYSQAFLELLERAGGLDVSGTRYWVEKTPANERFVPLSERWYHGTSRYLHIVRDPRDVFASWLIRTTLSGAARARVLVGLSFAWSQSVQLCRHYLRHCQGRYCLLRYEDLVGRTSEVMAGICWFLDIPMDERLLRPTVLGMPTRTNSSYPDCDGPGVVVRSQVRRYDEVLTIPEVELVEYLLRAQMAACGYPVVTTDPPQRRLAIERLPRGVRWDARSLIKAMKLVRVQRTYEGAGLPFVGSPGLAAGHPAVQPPLP